MKRNKGYLYFNINDPEGTKASEEEYQATLQKQKEQQETEKSIQEKKENERKLSLFRAINAKEITTFKKQLRYMRMKPIRNEIQKEDFYYCPECLGASPMIDAADSDLEIKYEKKRMRIDHQCDFYCRVCKTQVVLLRYRNKDDD